MSAPQPVGDSLLDPKRPLKAVVRGVFEIKPATGNPVEFEVCAIYDPVDGSAFVLTNQNGASIFDVMRLFIDDVSGVPDFLKDVTIKKFLVKYAANSQDTKFTVELIAKIKDVETRLYYASGNGASTISAGLRFGPHIFTVKYATVDTVSFTLGSYKLDKPVFINEFIKSILGNDYGLPAIELKNFEVFYLKRSKNEPTKDYSMIGFRVKLNVEEILKSLPAVGEAAAKYIPFRLNEIILFYVSAHESNSTVADKKEAKRIFNETLGIKSSGLEIEQIENGLNLYTDITVQPIEINLTGSGNPGTGQGSEDEGPQNSPSPPVEQKPEVKEKAADGITWSEVNFDKLGIQIKKVGYKADLKAREVNFYIDANVTLSILSLQVRGLGLGFKITNLFGRFPDVTLSGLGLSLKKGPIEISGAFLLTPVMIDVVDEKGERGKKPFKAYSGIIIIKLTAIRIAGIGQYVSYQDYKTGKRESKTSLFVFAVFNGSLGGIPEFFVTGIAAGFGYNRTIKIPTIEKVRDFPLVALVMAPDEKKTAMDILDDLVRDDLIPVSEGNYWFAAGIKFTTYQVLETFILLIVLFGKRLEFVVIGLSTLRLPKGDGVKQVANIELTVMLRYSPDSDVITIQGIITSASWIFNKDCKLAGGFAVFFWVKGPHAGDFVLSVGGYHPRFKKPDHYPTVPRLSLTWQVTDSVSIKGEMYFALTSTAIMAGGKWQLSYDGDSIKASILIWIDMLIAWAPFSYDLEVGVIIKINANVKIALIRFRGSAEVGAMLKIWGPPFAGRAMVKWSVISFEINFGDQKAKLPPPLRLSEFCMQFIPGAVKQKTGNNVIVQAVKISIEAGIIEDVEKPAPYCIVNSSELKIKLDALIPITKKIYDDKELTGLSQVGVQPMDLRSLTSGLIFSIVRMTRNGSNTDELTVAGNTGEKVKDYTISNKSLIRSSPAVNTINPNGEFEASIILKKSPASLWSSKAKDEISQLDTPQPLNTFGGVFLQPVKKDKSLSAPVPVNTNPVARGKKMDFAPMISTDPPPMDPAQKQEALKTPVQNSLISEINELLKKTGIDKMAADRQKWIDSLQHTPLFCTPGQDPSSI